MTQNLNKTGKDLNATFLPNALIRKNQNKMLSSLSSKYQFQKTTGNAFIMIDPPQIKFAGYQIEKSYTATVKIINRVPVQQRIIILPPEEQGFSIKTNKRGNIAPGMSQNITVIFKSNQFKYQHDIIRITTQTQNFVIPLYAYPTLPDLRSIFPKLIDFGTVQVKETSTFYYPIKNTVPLNFQFEFFYNKQCQEIIITPLKGLISSMQTIIIEISFLPSSKSTFISEVLLSIKQFDFQPLPITIMGNGVQKIINSQSKRIKSSKLAPLKDEQVKKTPSSTLRRRPSGQKTGSALNISNPMNITSEHLQTQNIGLATFKKGTIRTNYPKLINTKKTVLIEEDMNKTLNPAKIAEKQYLNRYNRIQQLDKQKQIKFANFLGDKPMNQSQLQFQRQLAQQIQRVRSNALQIKCQERYSTQKYSQVSVQYKIVPKMESTWDDKKNDELSKRKQSLLRFMNAGSKIILKYRLLKRLGKIKQFLSECSNKQQVRKKIQDSHAKALDQQQGFSASQDLVLNFDTDFLRPNFYPLQFQENNKNQKDISFKPQGKCSFDDLKQIKELKPHKIELLKFNQLSYPADYFNHNKFIPKSRASGQQQWYLKSSGLPQYQFQPLTSIYSLPPKITAHHFIYDDFSVKRYKNYVSKDQKDPQVFLDIDSEVIQDEFQGWTNGQHQILKAKFTRNLGCEYNTFSSFNYSSQTYKMPALSTLGQDLPFVLEAPDFQDIIQQGDSDEQKVVEVPVEAGLKLIQLAQAKNEQLKQRRSKNIIKNPQKDMLVKIQKNIKNQKDKALGQFIGKVKQANRWIQRPSNRFLI